MSISNQTNSNFFNLTYILNMGKDERLRTISILMKLLYARWMYKPVSRQEVIQLLTGLIIPPNIDITNRTEVISYLFGAGSMLSWNMPYMSGTNEFSMLLRAVSKNETYASFIRNKPKLNFINEYEFSQLKQIIKPDAK